MIAARTSTSALDTSAQALRLLAARPLCLLAVLLALNAVVRPYANITHDARLYSVQALNRVEGGAYDDDLFFRYGSQDQFSLFSRMMVPAVALLGLQESFFLVYLLANALLIWAMKGLVERLVADRALSTVALFFLVVAPLNYGGQRTLHVHEPFLTPRLLACGLVLLGLCLTLDGRRRWALAPLFAAATMHPLMAAGGLLIWTGCTAVAVFGRRGALAAGVAVTVLAGGVLAIPALATRVFGAMDDEWREAIHRASAFNFATEWRWDDWANILLAYAGIAALARHSDKSCSKNMLGVAGIVGVAAVAGTLIAESLPYAFLLQGQPYRALWILRVLQVPGVLVLAAGLWRSGVAVRQFAAVAVLTLLFTDLRAPAIQWGFPLFFWPFTAIACRGAEAEPRRPDWAVRSLGLALVFGAGGWALYKEWLVVAGRDALLAYHSLFEFVRIMVSHVGPVWLVLLPVGAIVSASRVRLAPRALMVGAALLVAVAQLANHVLPQLDYFRTRHMPNLSDMLFVRDQLQRQRGTSSKLPTVYSPFGHIEYVWLELPAQCYFDWWQAGGYMYRRETAAEGERRARLIAPFAIERFRKLERFLDDDARHNIERFLSRDIDGPRARTADLATLCREPMLDYVVLDQEFPGLVLATNGHVYLYDCRRVRAALPLTDRPTPVAALRFPNEIP